MNALWKYGLKPFLVLVGWIAMGMIWGAMLLFWMKSCGIV